MGLARCQHADPREDRRLESLDDCARAFFGIDVGSEVLLTYRFDDGVAALQAVVAHERAAFLCERLDGLTRGGCRLVYTDTDGAAPFERLIKDGKRYRMRSTTPAPARVSTRSSSRAAEHRPCSQASRRGRYNAACFSSLLICRRSSPA